MAVNTQATRQSSTKIKPPKRYKVIIYNDDFTTMEFVVELLMEVFHKTEEEALNIMMAIHRGTKAVVGVYSLDIAKTKASRAVSMARQEGFPLRVEVEPESPSSF